jgi:hypothetical protein
VDLSKDALSGWQASPLLPTPRAQGKLVRILTEHAHWVTTMALSNDHALRTGPFGHEGKRPKDDEEGAFLGGWR